LFVSNPGRCPGLVRYALSGLIILFIFNPGRCPGLLCYALSGLIILFIFNPGRCPGLLCYALSGLIILFIFNPGRCPGKGVLSVNMGYFLFFAYWTESCLLTRTGLIRQYILYNRAECVSKRFVINATNKYFKACLPKGNGQSTG